MITFKCKMCGGDLHPEENATTCECEYCGSVQTIPTADNEKKGNLFNRANRLRMAAEYDKATAVYTSITAEFPEEAEAYWGLCLCKYGIEYVEDPVTAKKIPTCHRTRSESIMDDPDFDQACENADAVAKRVYREEAKAIDRLQQDILSVVANESPYDVFICYKETDDDGQRTEDSVLAQDIYDSLTAKGMKVFFARITLEDKLGQQYEPYIYAALHSAKVMLAIGTQFEYFDAVWVKNEWSRFLDMMKSDKSKTLIPCYKDIDAYDMPREFKNLQAQDMKKLGWMQDLTRGVMKLCGKDEQQSTITKVQQASSFAETNKTDAMLTRIRLFMQDGDWEKAGDYIERVLDIDPKCSEAYLLRLMVVSKCKTESELEQKGTDISEDKDFLRACEFADEAFHGQLETIRKRCSDNIIESNIAKARKMIQDANNDEMFKQALDILNSNKEHSDAAALLEQCKQKQIEFGKRRENLPRLRKRVNECMQLFDVDSGQLIYIKQDKTLGFYNLEDMKPGLRDSEKQLYEFAKNLTDVHSISYANYRFACILNDGSVRAYYQNGIDSKTGAHKPSYWDTSNWHDVVSIKQDTGMGNHYLFGFRVDGTILVTGQDANTYFSFLPELKDVDCILHAEVYKEKTSFTYVSKDDNVYTRDKEADQFILEKGPSSRHVIQVMDDFYLCADGTAYSKGSQKAARVYKYYCGAPQDCVAVVEGSYENDFCTYLNTEGIVRGRGKRGNFVWNNIVAIKGDFQKCIGLTNDGRLLCYDMKNNKDIGEIPDIQLFDSVEDLGEERKQYLRKIKKHYTFRLQAEVDGLNRQLSDAQQELSNLKGLFTGKRKKELESTINDLKRKIREQEQELNKTE